MTFAEKLRKARKMAGMTQKELAEAAHLSLRTVANYEGGDRMPQRADTYRALARALDITEESLKDDLSDFVVTAQEKYGSKGRRQAEEVVQSFRLAAAGGELSDDDLDFIKEAMMQTYEDAKRYNQRFVNKRYQKDAGKDEN